MASSDTPPEDVVSDIEIDSSDPSVNYYKRDDRQNQEYWGQVVVNYDMSLPTSALPSWEETTSRISKYEYLLNRVASMASDMAHLGAIGVAPPGEFGLNEKRDGLDLPEDPPERIILSEKNLITDDPIRPFDELEKLELQFGIGSSSGFGDKLQPGDDTAPFYVRIELTARVERPSQAPSKEDLLHELSALESKLLAFVNPALARAAELMRARVWHRKDTNWATQLAQHWAKEFKSDARKRINFQKRLDALYNELEEETHKVAEEMLEEWTDEEIAEELDAPLSVVDTVKKHWEDYLHVGSGFSPGSENLNPADVTPRAEIQEMHQP